MEAPQEQLQNQVHEAEPVLEPEEVSVAEAVQGVLDRGKEVDRHERGARAGGRLAKLRAESPTPELGP